MATSSNPTTYSKSSVVCSLLLPVLWVHVLTEVGPRLPGHVPRAVPAKVFPRALTAPPMKPLAAKASYKSWTWSPGGRDCFSLSALSESVTHKVYKYLEQRTLNLVTSPVFLIFTERASFLRAVNKKSLIS